MRTFLLFITCFCLSVASTFGQQKNLPNITIAELHTGDLIFAVNQKGNAITQSTSVNDELPIDHVGIFYVKDEKPYVIEAAPKHGVAVAEADSFMADNPFCVAGRVPHLDISNSISNALSRYGLPYDSLFEATDSAFYCSELVQKSFVDSTGQHVFSTIPMSFHDSNGAILPFWIDFYSRHGRQVPDGEPGTNPGQLARSGNIRLLGWFHGTD